MRKDIKNSGILSKSNIVLPNEAGAENPNDIQYLDSDTPTALLARASGYFNVSENTAVGSFLHDKEEEEKKKKERAHSIFASNIDLPFSLFKTAFAMLTAAPESAPTSAANKALNFFKETEDEEFLYGTTQVSQEVYEIIAEETAWLIKELEEYHNETDPAKRAQKAIELKDIAKYVGAKIDLENEEGPKILAWDYERLYDMQENFIRSGQVRGRCDKEICVYSSKAPSANGGRRMKVDVGDQYNQDPREAISAGDHLKGQAPALHLH